MWSTAREIAAGDLVIVWMVSLLEFRTWTCLLSCQSRDQLQPVIIEPGKDINIKYGHYRHSDFIGIPFGSKVGSRTGRGFIYLLRPTPELWTMALPHRTQILYLADIAFITSHLDIRQGSRVIEAGKFSASFSPPKCSTNLSPFDWAAIIHISPQGTGSGSFSHSVLRTIGSTGHLWSYEFHEVRATKARSVQHPSFTLHLTAKKGKSLHVMVYLRPSL